MHNFTQKKIALAVGASLMVMAGAANAAGVNPTVRTKGIVATVPAGVVAAQDLYSATGYTGNILVTIYLQPAADTVTPANSQGISDAGVLINNIAGGGPTGAGATSANNDFAITYGAGPVYFPITVGGITFTANTIVGGVALVAAKAAGAYATYQVNIGPVAGDANGAFRINGANLEYTQDNSIASPVWNVVNVQGYTAGVNPITSTDDPGGAASTAVTFTAAAAPAVMGTAPTPKLSTRSSASISGGQKIVGLTIDTLTPIATLTKTTNFTVQAEGTATTGCVGSTIVDNKDITAASTGAVALTGTANTVVFLTPDTVTWTNAPAGDAAAYSTTCFNTGVSATAVPFTVTLVPAAEPAYTNVVTPATGDAALMAALPGNAAITDGAAPVFVSAVSSSLTDPSDLILTFSEPIAGIAGDAPGADGQDLREVAENVKLGADTIAALGLNAGWDLSIDATGATAGQGTLVISGIDAAEFSKQVAVTKGISVKDQDDGGWSSTTDAQDNAGIFTSATSEFIPAVAATAITLAKATIAFTNADGDLKASATPVVADPTKIGQIDIAATAGNEMALGSGKTAAQLAAHLVVTINGKYGNTPTVFKIYPTATDVAVTTGGGLTITLPTKLIYEKIDAVTNVTVTYTGTVDGVSDVLVGKTDATVIVAAGTENVSIPVSLSAGALDNTLFTQSVIGSFNSTANGDKVEAYLARWDDAPAASTPNVISVGQNNKIGTQYADIYASCGTGCGTDTADLVTLVEAELDAVAAAKAAVPGVSNATTAVASKPIPGYVVGNKLFVAHDGTGKNDLRQAYDNAVNAARSLSSDIRDAAKDAGSSGARATGADMSNTNNSGTSNAGSINAAMNAGVAMALATLADKASNFNLPDSVVLAAKNAASAPNSTVSGVVAAILGADLGMGWVQAVNIDPVKGAITGRDGAKVSGNVELKNAPVAGNRGLKLFDGTTFGSPAAGTVNGAAVVGTVNGVSNRFNLLLGTDPKTTDFNSLKKPTFVLLVHTSAVDNSQRLLTSANPRAANFLPYEPNLQSLSGTRKEIALDLSKISKVSPAGSTNWALYGMGNPARVATPPADHKVLFERDFVGLDTGTGKPVSLWTNDSFGTDMAMAMVGNKTFVSTELKANGETLTTITPTSYVAGAEALAWANDKNSDGSKPMFVQQAAAVTSKVPVGWSLVTVPSTGLLPTATVVNAVIKVGSQLASGKQYTWITGDTTPPALTAGEAVFVYSKLGGALN